MKTHPKRTLLAWLLTFAMLLSLLPMAAFAEDAEDEGYSVTMTASYSYEESEDYTYYYVFDTDDLTLSVEKSEDSSDLPDGYTVEFSLNGEDDSSYVNLTDNENGTATLSVALSEDLENEGYTGGHWVDVYAIVSYEGNEIANCELQLEVLVA
ncbi:MAG: hypothetical protein LUD69_05380 [Oscillospiraceae bacterium]|nr:hypothetical protein [Oscillospiraceae bacterium]